MRDRLLLEASKQEQSCSTKRLTCIRFKSDSEHDPSRRRLDDDPVAAACQAKVPMLFIYGDSDPWVPVTKSVARLQSLIQQRQDIEYAVIAGANHEMMFPGKEIMQADANTSRHDALQAPAYFVLLGSWLSRRVARQ